MTRILRRALFVSGFLAMVAAAQPQPTHPGLAYATVGGRPLLLDLYLPASGTEPYPVVVWIHGGGWTGGSRFPAGLAQPLTNAGFAVASVDYRLTSQAGLYGTEPVTFPAQIHDCKGAIRWLRAHAGEYGLDRSRFGAWGSSAGGHLAALVGTSGGAAAIEGTIGGFPGFTSRVQACADYFGPTDLLNMSLDVTTPPGSNIDHDAPNSPESRLIGWDDPGQGIGDIRENLNNPMEPYPSLVELCDQANPITFVDPADPPFFIAHGTMDPVVPLNQSTRLATTLTSAGVFCDYRQIAGAGHGGLGSDTEQAVLAFFEARLMALPSVVGDVTGDRRVDLRDLAIVLSAFGRDPRGDLDYDADTDLADLALLLSTFGE